MVAADDSGRPPPGARLPAGVQADDRARAAGGVPVVAIDRRRRSVRRDHARNLALVAGLVAPAPATPDALHGAGHIVGRAARAPGAAEVAAAGGQVARGTCLRSHSPCSTRRFRCFLSPRRGRKARILALLTPLVWYLQEYVGGPSSTFEAWSLARAQWQLLFIYFPCLVMVLRRPNAGASRPYRSAIVVAAMFRAPSTAGRRNTQSCSARETMLGRARRNPM